MLCDLSRFFIHFNYPFSLYSGGFLYWDAVVKCVLLPGICGARKMVFLEMISILFAFWKRFYHFYFKTGNSFYNFSQMSFQYFRVIPMAGFYKIRLTWPKLFFWVRSRKDTFYFLQEKLSRRYQNSPGHENFVLEFLKESLLP